MGGLVAEYLHGGRASEYGHWRVAGEDGGGVIRIFSRRDGRTRSPWVQTGRVFGSFSHFVGLEYQVSSSFLVFYGMDKLAGFV